MQNWFFSLMLSINILTALSVIGLVLVQHGKGADMGAAFGGGSSGSLFGATGSASFLSRTTGVLAAIFFATSLALTWIAASRNPQASNTSVMQLGETPGIPATATNAPGDAAKEDSKVSGEPAATSDSNKDSPSLSTGDGESSPEQQRSKPLEIPK